MKKTLVLVLIVLMASTALFGEITMGAWGRGVLATGTSGDEIETMSDKSWGGDGIRVGYNVNGVSENVGFQLAFDFNGQNHDASASFDADNEIDLDGDPATTGDIIPFTDVDTRVQVGLANIWVKPHEMVKLTIGAFNADTLRGNAEFGSWNWVRYNAGWHGEFGLGIGNRWGNVIGEDHTFARVESRNGGFMVELTPMEALYVVAALQAGPGSTGGGLDEGVVVADALSSGQYGVGYTIEGIGQVKAQFIGINEDADGWFNAAFKLTAVENLTAEVGLYAPTGDDIQTTDDVMRIAMYAKYIGVEATTIHLATDLYMFDDLEYEIALGVDRNMGALTLNSDVRIYNEFRNQTDDALGWGAFAGVSKGLASGKVGVGFELTNMSFATGHAGEEAGDVAWVVPVLLEYWF